MPCRARSAYGMALGTATAGPEAALAGRGSDGATRTRRTGDGIGRVATLESGFDKALQRCNIGACVDTGNKRGDMADVIDFSGRNAAAKETGKGYRAFELTSGPGTQLFLVYRDPILRYAELESIAPVPGIASNRAVMLRFGGSTLGNCGSAPLGVCVYIRWGTAAIKPQQWSMYGIICWIWDRSLTRQRFRSYEGQRSGV